MLRFALRALGLTAIAAVVCWPRSGRAERTGTARGLTTTRENGVRRALVIGNQAYPRSPLENPTHDAEDMAAKVRTLGFDVTLLEDQSLRQLNRRVDDYVAQLGRGDISFVYYSGHGVQVEGENFLVPTDFAGQDEKDVRYDAYPLDKLMDKLGDRRLALSIVVLDACRDNPFRASRGGLRGLAGVSTASGTLVAFATSPGKAAADGAPGQNGVYTASLLRALDREGVDVDELFKLVREDVAAKTGNEQVPWSSSSVLGKFCLNGSCVPTKGTLQIVTFPPGADVLIDNVHAGTSPLERPISLGEHSVTVSLAHFASASQSVSVEAGRTASVVIPLTGTVGTLQVDTLPHGASVSVDRQPATPAPFSAELEAGNHALTVSLEEYAQQKRSVLVEPGKTSSLMIVLTPTRGMLRVETTPQHAHVLVDGRDRGTTPFIHGVEAGPHVIELRLAGYLSARQEVTVEGGSTAVVVKALASLASVNLRPGQSADAAFLTGSKSSGASPMSESRRAILKGLGIAGVVIGGLGLASATGLVVDVRTESTAFKAHPPPTGTIQGAVSSLNTRITTSNVLFPVGGGLAAAGVALTVAF